MEFQKWNPISHGKGPGSPSCQQSGPGITAECPHRAQGLVTLGAVSVGSGVVFNMIDPSTGRPRQLTAHSCQLAEAGSAPSPQGLPGLCRDSPCKSMEHPGDEALWVSEASCAQLLQRQRQIKLSLLCNAQNSPVEIIRQRILTCQHQQVRQHADLCLEPKGENSYLAGM